MQNVRVGLFFVLLLSACNSSPKDVLHIATAANVQFAMAELTEYFTRETGIQTEVILSSSGKLTAQILQGAPYDLFLSADMKYPLELQKKGKVLSPPQVYALGALVLWTTDTSFALSLETLLEPSVKKIAIANPKTAPYGEAAIAFFDHKGWTDSLREKLVFGESIAQTNQFILSGAAQLGLTAKSVVRSPEMQQVGQWVEVPADLYRPIEQGAVIVNPEREQEARAFINFLSSEPARQILTSYGYRLMH